MQRLACRAANRVFTEKTAPAIVPLDLCLFSKLADINSGDPLEECHTFENRLDRTDIIQLLKESAYRRNNLHQPLHNLLRHFQHNRSSLSTSSGIALLPRHHTVLTHIFASPENGNRQ